MDAIWTEEERTDLAQISHECLESECRAIGSLLLHERDSDEKEELENRYLQVNELRKLSDYGFLIYVGENVMLQPRDGGAMTLSFDAWICDDIPS